MDTTLEFEKIADHIVKVPGRKTLIWMSEGVPLVVGGSYFDVVGLHPVLGRLPNDIILSTGFQLAFASK